MRERPRFIDTHVHFNDMAHPMVRWTWLEAGAPHGLIANPEGYKHVRYTSEEFRAETRFCSVDKVVHVQAALGTPDPVSETIWLEEMADRTGWPDAIIAEAFLRAPDADRLLARQAEHRRVIGVRDLQGPSYAEDPDFARGYRSLHRHGLSLALAPTWHEMPAVERVARDNPETLLILEHAGMPLDRTDDAYRTAWTAALRSIARLEHVVIKISGLGMAEPDWTPASIRPWIHGCLEAFGADRCMMGTNWPVDRLFSSYPDLVDAYVDALADLQEHERNAVLADNAERILGI